MLRFYHRLFLPFGCWTLFYSLCAFNVNSHIVGHCMGCISAACVRRPLNTAGVSNVCTLGGAGGGRMYECLANINIGLSRQPKSNTAAGHTWLSQILIERKNWGVKTVGRGGREKMRNDFNRVGSKCLGMWNSFRRCSTQITQFMSCWV